MLKEVEKVRQIEGEHKRRLFSDPSLDLYIWYDKNDHIVQFQICYDKGHDEHSLTWHFQNGLSHHAIDDGEGHEFRMKSTPILFKKKNYNKEEIITKFEQLAGGLEYQLVQFIISRINEIDD